MIYGKKDYEDEAKYKHDFNIDQVAKELEKRIKKFSDIAYDGYSINRMTLTIRFYVKTGDGREYVEYDPCTLAYHVQNDLQISEFDQQSIYELLVLFAQIREVQTMKSMGFSKEQIERMLNGGNHEAQI